MPTASPQRHAKWAHECTRLLAGIRAGEVTSRGLPERGGAQWHVDVSEGVRADRPLAFPSLTVAGAALVAAAPVPVRPPQIPVELHRPEGRREHQRRG